MTGTMTDVIGIVFIGFVYSVQIGKEKKAKTAVTTQML